MSFFELIKYKKHHIRRDSWPNRCYLNVVDMPDNGTVKYWNNDSFQWEDKPIFLKDFAANDWLEEK